MDRIRKALDLARQSREQGDAIELAHETASRPQAVPEMHRRLPGLPAKIDYSITRVFTPDMGLFESNRILDPAGKDLAVNAFRMLRTQVIQRMDENGWRSLAVMSPSVRDGKTTTAINLAISLANDRRHTVLLVDCDLRRPQVASHLGIAPEHGLDDLLRGDAGVEQCLYHPEGFDRLVVLPVREPVDSAADSMAGPRGRELVAELRGRYPERILVFDLPPVLGTDDALAFLPLVECGLVVIAERQTRRDELLRCMELLRSTPLIGTVLNKSTESRPNYA